MRVFTIFIFLSSILFCKHLRIGLKLSALNPRFVSKTCDLSALFLLILFVNQVYFIFIK